jgi:hypothetical protein
MAVSKAKPFSEIMASLPAERRARIEKRVRTTLLRSANYYARKNWRHLRLADRAKTNATILRHLREADRCASLVRSRVEACYK